MFDCSSFLTVIISASDSFLCALVFDFEHFCGPQSIMISVSHQVMMLILLGMALVGPALSDDDDRRRLFLVGRRPRPLQQLLRPLIGGALAGRPLIGGKNLISNFYYFYFEFTIVLLLTRFAFGRSGWRSECCRSR